MGSGAFEPFTGDVNYPVPGSGTYLSGATGLTGVTYASQGTPYVPGGGVATVPGTPAAGLFRSKYKDKPGGYSWNGTTGPTVSTPANWDMNFPSGYQFIRSINDTYISWGNQTDTAGNTNFCMQWLGYIQAPATASFNMFIESDDDSVVWIGTPALTGNYTNSNFAVKTSNARTINTNTMQWTANQYYPIRIWYSEVTGSCKFQMYFQKADGTKYNGSDMTWAYNTVTNGF